MHKEIVYFNKYRIFAIQRNRVFKSLKIWFQDHNFPIKHAASILE